MRFKFTILVLYFISHNIETYNLDRDTRFSFIKISCSHNETISLDGIASIKNFIQNYSKIDLIDCMSLPFAQLSETLGMKVNQTSKELHLGCTYNMTAENLTGIDKHHVRLFFSCYSTNTYLDRVVVPPFDLFSTLSELQELFILVADIEDLPDLSKLHQLELLSVTFHYVQVPNSKLNTNLKKIGKKK